MGQGINREEHGLAHAGPCSRHRGCWEPSTSYPRRLPLIPTAGPQRASGQWRHPSPAQSKEQRGAQRTPTMTSGWSTCSPASKPTI